MPAARPRQIRRISARRAVVAAAEEAAAKLLDEDGWKIGADGIREKEIDMVLILYSFETFTGEKLVMKLAS